MIKVLSLGIAAMLALLACGIDPSKTPPSREGRYRAVLRCPGGDLPFLLEIASSGAKPTATVLNGEERIAVPTVVFEANRFLLGFDHYDSRIEGTVASDGRTWQGEWVKVGQGGALSRLPFVASRGDAERFPSLGAPIRDFGGRYRVTFEKSDDPAVAVFDQEGAQVRGTFLTTTGDYRYLAGRADGERLSLSCFDGAHAFLFHAAFDAGGELSGDFWSRDSWHETFRAVRDPSAQLSDPFAEVAWSADAVLADVRFPDTEGVVRSLEDESFRGKARILYLFGSWCPNCHDATEALKGLLERHGASGLKVLGLAFEHTEDFERNAQLVRRYRERHAVDFPVLIVGTSVKAEATQRFRLLDRIKSYPTTIFLKDGKVLAVHSGFSGPATGVAHEELLRRFESLVAEMLH